MQTKLLYAVLIAALLGIIAGIFLPGDPFFGIYNLLGSLFLRALTLMVVPLVAASIVTGTMKLGADGGLGRLGGSILIAFGITMAVAVAIGLFTILILHPGAGYLTDVANVTVLPSHVLTLESETTWGKIEQIFYRLVPTNVIDAASKGQIIGIILFSALFGVFSSQIGEPGAQALKNFWEASFKVLIKMTQFVMKFLPLGVFGLMAKTSATSGTSAIYSIGSFFLAALFALFLYAVIIWPLVLILIARVNPLKHVRAMAPALLTAFTTSSSAATLPVALECVEKEAGVSNRVSSLVMSLGIAVNLSASALYAAAVVAFIALTTGAPLDFGSIAFMYTVSLLTCFGMAGIPSASIIAVVLILQTLHLPADQLALVMAVERFADMIRTAINIYGNSCCAVVIARLEGETTAVGL